MSVITATLSFDKNGFGKTHMPIPRMFIEAIMAGFYIVVGLIMVIAPTIVNNAICYLVGGLCLIMGGLAIYIYLGSEIYGPLAVATFAEGPLMDSISCEYITWVGASVHHLMNFHADSLSLQASMITQALPTLAMV